MRPVDFVDVAMARLESAGFTCTVGDPRDVECSRVRYFALITCVQRVRLVGARLRNAPLEVAVEPRRCFGGFG